MRRFLLSLVAVATALPVLAGGLMTNTNQSAAFLRSVARGTTLDSDAVYYNPAGTVFMKDGWHIGISDQMAYQTRSTTSTFAPFAMGANNNGLDTKEFKGSVFSALIPSFHLTWKKNRWAVMFGVGVNGGGGTIKYPNGLASFERMFAVLPGSLQKLGISASSYNADMLLKGNSMTLAFNVGAAFRITDWLSVAAQVRVGYTSNGYTGYMKNIAVGIGGNMLPATTVLGQAMTGLQTQYDGYKAQYDQLVAAGMGDSEAAQQLAGALSQLGAGMQTVGESIAKTSDHTLDVKQTGWSVSPIVALAFHYEKWDASIRYEHKMATKLKIKSAPVSANDPVINSIFADGSTVKAETPALLAVAASRWCGPVKISLGWNHYFDKQAENSFSNVVRGNTNEYLAGVEWQIDKRWLVSAGAQRTQFNLYENNYSDMNFSVSAWSAGLGFAVNIIENIRLNAGFMYTIYDKGVTATGVDAATGLDYKDVYKRTSISGGIGLDFYFGKRK